MARKGITEDYSRNDSAQNSRQGTETKDNQHDYRQKPYGQCGFPWLSLSHQGKTASTAHNSVPNTTLNLLAMRSRAMAL